ncbi:hypothetical protein JXJ21_02075 [candidate division KSB1 bacterium]|nr:hypothetical protein [candidate division KSB1 bacterium]
MRYSFEKLSFITNGFIEFGLVHRPWLDFEQNINRYRVQGTMFLERVGILKSADYGLTFSGLLGGKMDDTFITNVSGNNPGRYGSFAFGIYNGGGYEAIEKNNNKIVESRLTVRPFPVFFPGMQVSWIAACGKGNAKTSPDLSVNSGFISLEHERIILTGFYYWGTGNLEGSAVDNIGNSYKQNGYSVFGELKLFFNKRLRAMARFDTIDDEFHAGDWFKRDFIGGLSFYFYQNSKIVVAYDRMIRNGSVQEESSLFEIAVDLLY